MMYFMMVTFGEFRISKIANVLIIVPAVPAFVRCKPRGKTRDARTRFSNA